jgi:hypothetical protein
VDFKLQDVVWGTFICVTGMCHSLKTTVSSSPNLPPEVKATLQPPNQQTLSPQARSTCHATIQSFIPHPTNSAVSIPLMTRQAQSKQIQDIQHTSAISSFYPFSSVVCFLIPFFVFILFYSIQVMSPKRSVLDGSAPAHGLSKCKVSVSVKTRSTAQNPATPAVTKSRARPDSL